MNIIILGLSITSSWGNGHATIYRALVRELTRRGHDVTFLERDMPWYAANRDLPHPPFGRTRLYDSLDDLKHRFTRTVREADVVIVGSYVSEGVGVGQWAIDTTRGLPVFYDIDTPVTLAKLARGDHEYLTPELIPRYQLYLSFTGGPTLDRLENELGCPAARPLYCCVDPGRYHPSNPRHTGSEQRATSNAGAGLDLGYMGTYSEDRQPGLERLLIEPASRRPAHRFAVAGPQYPGAIRWPDNIERIEHLPPARHRGFYNRQRFTLNITRADMREAGYAPSVRLFEAGACGTPIITDPWPGLETFFTPGEEILVARCADDVLWHLDEMLESQRRTIAHRAREKVLARHTAAHRAAELERYVCEAAASA